MKGSVQPRPPGSEAAALVAEWVARLKKGGSFLGMDCHPSGHGSREIQSRMAAAGKEL